MHHNYLSDGTNLTPQDVALIARSHNPDNGKTSSSVSMSPAAQSRVNEEVVAGSAAETAGVRVGDVITKINDSELSEDHPLINVLTNFQPGDKVKLTLIRNGRLLTLDATLSTRQE